MFQAYSEYLARGRFIGHSMDGESGWIFMCLNISSRWYDGGPRDIILFRVMKGLPTVIIAIQEACCIALF